jgi:hypothetical protein
MSGCPSWPRFSSWLIGPDGCSRPRSRTMCHSGLCGPCQAGGSLQFRLQDQASGQQRSGGIAYGADIFMSRTGNDHTYLLRDRGRWGQFRPSRRAGAGMLAMQYEKYFALFRFIESLCSNSVTSPTFSACGAGSSSRQKLIKS